MIPTLLKQTNYLGIYLTNLVKNTHHYKYALKKAKCTQSPLYPILKCNNKFSNKNYVLQTAHPSTVDIRFPGLFRYNIIVSNGTN